ncbi:hypothetical protein COV20_03660 [Candidatus Woesearchaeota archaeon CG10_big_fil_rev_8_21_14_0_10_45_16]|nr:MAG: hypothetical protein COV20_03660 [Candidatus Woesearchaeota archaeon CG10_big_fil_rev_8_21_14_0_10_45_16]
MKQFNRLDIQEVKDDTIVFKDGSFCCVLAVSIPLEKSKTAEELRKNMKQFHQWLTSLDYPIQICARSVNYDLDKRLLAFRAKVERELLLSKEKNREKILESKRFFDWFERFIFDNATAQRLYYVTVHLQPYYRRFWQRKRLFNSQPRLQELKKRMMAAKKNLDQMGFDSKLLDDAQLVNLYSSYYLFSFYHDKGYYETIESSYLKWKEGDTHGYQQ